MARKRKRSWKAPMVLWQIFKNDARNLAKTIAFIIPRPSPPFTCGRCEGRSCLRCCEDPMSFLIRPDDPLDYVNLLNDCFVVVNEDAPFIDFYPDKRWTQEKLVVRVVEMMSSLRLTASNVICSGFNKHTNSSHIVELLTSSAWGILHERVGDKCMFHLLWHTTIFVPISDKKHLQVAGSPVNYFRKKSKEVKNPQSGRKRKRTYGSKSLSKGEFQGSSIQTAEKQKPFSRPFKWKRDKRHRLHSIPESKEESISRIFCFYEDCLSGSLVCLSNPNQAAVPCSCYLMLKAPRKVSNSIEISKQSMFYNMECSSSVLPEGHILNTLVPNFSSSKCLMENIFGFTGANVSSQSVSCSHNVECRLKGSSCLYHKFIKLLKMLIRRARRCNHLKLLEKYCPLPSLDQKAGKSRTIVERSIMDKRGIKRSRGGVAKENHNTPETDNAELESTRPYCLKSQVLEFLWAVCRSLVPPELLGAPSNWRLLKRNIFRFIRLRRFEKFSVMQCMHQLKSLDFPFLSDNGRVLKNGSELKFGEAICSEHDIKRELLVNWILWFFSSLVVPLVQANFYVTEGECGKLDVFYYRKPVWQEFIDDAVSCLKGRNYLEMDEAAVRAIIRKRPFGFSRLRLCPKQNGVRLLANLNASSKMLQEKSSKFRCSWMRKSSKARSRIFKSKCVKSPNSVLRGVHAILKGLLLKEPEKLGSTVFDYKDVYTKLHPFIITLKNASTMPGVFIVAADVSKAFDSVDQDKLLRMMEDVIVEKKYILQQNREIVWLKNRLLVRQSLMLVDETVNLGFTNLVSSVSCRSLSGVVVNQGIFTALLKEHLFSNLYQLLKCNVLQLDKKFYLQKLGIPQGSILSTLLCSLYYGHMEKHVIFPYLEKPLEHSAETLSSSPFDSMDARNSSEDPVIFPPTYLLLRFVDDFLFISTSKEQASSILSMFRQGFPDYNCYMNQEKFCLNFDIEHQSGILSNRAFTGDDSTLFVPWSGLLINSSTLEILGDYTRYLGKHLSCTLTVRQTGQPGNHLKHKLFSFMRPKCHSIFFDSSINSASVVRLNIYQAFLLSAMKFHCYVSELSDFFRPRRQYCLKIILKSFRHMHRLIEKQMALGGLSSGLCWDHKHKVVRNEVEWLGLTAFIEVLKRKQSRHKALLSMLRSKFFCHRITGKESCELRYAVERSHSSCLWKIKY
ncbi:hypothetical protein E1A91_A05G429500v1 [Gossypium mustelinum]|uniref:Telomerase reverse transcriptase n=1 Tax=Gossypium mustelinum TaxID=34275 RepID=A0A5D2ZJE4_GOSMU|nr:hypothetical protein E1A91_A05G429500v1 [Gossypium mustelinum]